MGLSDKTKRSVRKFHRLGLGRTYLQRLPRLVRAQGHIDLVSMRGQLRDLFLPRPRGHDRLGALWSLFMRIGMAGRDLVVPAVLVERPADFRIPTTLDVQVLGLDVGRTARRLVRRVRSYGSDDRGDRGGRRSSAVDGDGFGNRH